MPHACRSLSVADRDVELKSHFPFVVITGRHVRKRTAESTSSAKQVITKPVVAIRCDSIESRKQKITCRQILQLSTFDLPQLRADFDTIIQRVLCKRIPIKNRFGCRWLVRRPKQTTIALRKPDQSAQISLRLQDSALPCKRITVECRQQLLLKQVILLASLRFFVGFTACKLIVETRFYIVPCFKRRIASKLGRLEIPICKIEIPIFSDHFVDVLTNIQFESCNRKIVVNSTENHTLSISKSWSGIGSGDPIEINPAPLQQRMPNLSFPERIVRRRKCDRWTGIVVVGYVTADRIKRPRRGRFLNPKIRRR